MEKLAVSLTEAAALMGVGKSWLYQELKTGRVRLPLIQMGSRRVVRVEDVQAWLEAAAQRGHA